MSGSTRIFFRVRLTRTVSIFIGRERGNSSTARTYLFFTISLTRIERVLKLGEHCRENRTIRARRPSSALLETLAKPFTRTTILPLGETFDFSRVSIVAQGGKKWFETSKDSRYCKIYPTALEKISLFGNTRIPCNEATDSSLYRMAKKWFEISRTPSTYSPIQRNKYKSKIIVNIIRSGSIPLKVFFYRGSTESTIFPSTVVAPSSSCITARI